MRGGLEETTAYVLAGVVFLVGVQLHCMYVWRFGKEDTINRLMALHQDYQVSIDKFEESQVELAELRDKLHAVDDRENAEIVAEMHVLQTMLKQVIDKSGKSLDHRNTRDSPIENSDHLGYCG